MGVDPDPESGWPWAPGTGRPGRWTDPHMGDERLGSWLLVEIAAGVDTGAVFVESDGVTRLTPTDEDRGALENALDILTNLGISVDPGFEYLFRERSDAAAQRVAALRADLSQRFHWIVRVWIGHGDVGRIVEAVNRPDTGVVGVFSDARLAFTQGTGSALGDVAAVRRQHGINTMWNAWSQRTTRGQTNSAVLLAVVDTGICRPSVLAALNLPAIATDNMLSCARTGGPPWSPQDTHGTMVAVDAMISAPSAVLVDISVVQRMNSGIEVWTSDILAGYNNLKPALHWLSGGQIDGLVVCNSWALFSKSADAATTNSLQVWQPYWDNPAHPLNDETRVFDGAGADLVFAAGNCGPPGSAHMSSPCRGESNDAIYGANSSPFVLTVTSADLNDQPIQEVSRGIGALHREKPDVAAYSGFLASNPPTPDCGTSAACGVASGVVAALRIATGRKFTPAQLRDWLRQNARPLRHQTGHSLHFGHGLLDVSKFPIP